MSLLAAGKTRSVVNPLSIRLVHKIITQYVVLASSRLGIGFIVRIRTFSHDVGLRVKNMAGR